MEEAAELDARAHALLPPDLQSLISPEALAQQGSTTAAEATVPVAPPSEWMYLEGPREGDVLQLQSMRADLGWERADEGNPQFVPTLAPLNMDVFAGLLPPRIMVPILGPDDTSVDPRPHTPATHSEINAEHIKEVSLQLKSSLNMDRNRPGNNAGVLAVTAQWSEEDWRALFCNPQSAFRDALPSLVIQLLQQCEAPSLPRFILHDQSFLPTLLGRLKWHPRSQCKGQKEARTLARCILASASLQTLQPDNFRQLVSSLALRERAGEPGGDFEVQLCELYFTCNSKPP